MRGVRPAAWRYRRQPPRRRLRLLKLKLKSDTKTTTENDTETDTTTDTTTDTATDTGTDPNRAPATATLSLWTRERSGRRRLCASSPGRTPPSSARSSRTKTCRVSRCVIHSFVHAFIHPFIHSSMHPFIHSFKHSFSTGQGRWGSPYARYWPVRQVVWRVHAPLGPPISPRLPSHPLVRACVPTPHSLATDSRRQLCGY
jgi:hypothetical protein